MIGDFGLAKLVQGELCGVLGTWQWLAPEVIDNKAESYDERSDIYSFGIILYELTTFRVPFDEFSNDERFCKEGSILLMNIKHAIIHENLRPTIPQELYSTVPVEFLNLITACLAENPQERPTTAFILFVLASLLEDYDKDFIEKQREKMLSNQSTELTTPRASLKQSFDDEDIPFKPILYPELAHFDVNETTRQAFQQSYPMDCFFFSESNPEKVNCSVAIDSAVWVGCTKGTLHELRFIQADASIQLVNTLQPHTNRINCLLNINSLLWCASDDKSISIIDPKVVFQITSFKEQILTFECHFYK